MRGILRRPSRPPVPSIVDSITSASTAPPPSYTLHEAPLDQVASRRARYSAWPWYLPPPGWIVHPSWDSSLYPPDWTAFIPNSSTALREHPRPAHPAPAPESVVDYSPWMPPARPGSLRSTTLPSPRSFHSSEPPTPPPGVDPLDVPGPSPFFARTPASGPHDPVFAAYRKAQAESPGSHRHPQIHPAFSPPPGQDTADLRWDLSLFPDFSLLAARARVPLQPEEEHTFLTHPPLTFLLIRYSRAPTLSFPVSAVPPSGVTIADLLAAAFAFATRRLSVEEYAALGKEGQERVRSAAARRGVGGYAPMGETPYTVLDVLGSRRMFHALVPAERGVWVLVTTRRPRRRAGTGG